MNVRIHFLDKNYMVLKVGMGSLYAAPSHMWAFLFLFAAMDARPS
jgi:hypothetical protein